MLLIRKHQVLVNDWESVLPFCIAKTWLKNHAINLTEWSQGVHLKQLIRHAGHVVYVALASLFYYYQNFQLTKGKKRTCWKVIYSTHFSLNVNHVNCTFCYNVLCSCIHQNTHEDVSTCYRVKIHTWLYNTFISCIE